MAGSNNNASTSLDKWREYFRTANSDIFEIIEHAIIVAASDCPYEFKLKRDRIAEMLFTCKVTKCFGCERIGLALPVDDDGVQKSDDKCKSGIEAGASKESTKESKSNSTGDDYHREIMEMMNANQVSNNSYDDDAEALTDEIEEESQYLSEVLRIKEIIDNNEHESESLLFDSLRKLQLMRFSVETLKATEIGKSVNALRKHRSNDIRKLARVLIEDWKLMVDAWVSTTAAIAGAVDTPQSVKTSVDGEEEEDGLPSPPLDEGAFFATPTSMELSQFFDGMDDDGNPRNSGEFNKNRDHGRKPTIEKAANGPNYPPRNNKPEQKRDQESMLKPNNRPRPVSGVSGPGRPKPVLQTKANSETVPQQKPDKARTIQQKPVPPQREKMNGNHESPVRMNLEAAKRKLQERYQEIEKVKKQKTIQVIDLPKQNFASRNHPIKPAANQNRHRANGRR